MTNAEWRAAPAGPDVSVDDDWSLGQQPLRSNDSTPARAVLSRDRRRFYRVYIELQGRFMRADKQEYACHVINISPGGIAIASPVAGDPGERIILYIDHLGRFEGEVVRHFVGGFAVRFSGTAYKREKIANQLTWLVNKYHLDMAEERAHERMVPGKERVTVTTSDGVQHQVRVLDISLGGASVSMLPKPPVGELVTIGLLRGTIVRHHDLGVGIRFDQIQDPATIELHFGTPGSQET